jgi:crossover junction endodeoxyribonuclease RuvC
MVRQKTKRILGIDPGFARTGWGIIEAGSRIDVVDYGCIETHKGMDYSDRLISLSKELNRIIKKHKPELAGVEQLFFVKNVKTGIQVGEARGIIILTLAQGKLPICEFTPLQIKQAVAGYGNADKGQVQRMVKTLLNLKTIPKPDDAADALAVAICTASSVNSKH